MNLQALAMRREMGDREGLVLALGNLSVAYRFMGHAEKGLAMGVEQLAVARELRDDRAVADALSGLALSHILLGDAGRRMAICRRRSRFMRKSGMRLGWQACTTGWGRRMRS